MLACLLVAELFENMPGEAFTHFDSQLCLSVLRPPSCPDEPPGHSALAVAGQQVGHSVHASLGASSR